PAAQNASAQPAHRTARAEQPSSAAAAALSDKKLRQTNIAAAVGCSDWFGFVHVDTCPTPAGHSPELIESSCFRRGAWGAAEFKPTDPYEHQIIDWLFLSRLRLSHATNQQ